MKNVKKRTVIVAGNWKLHKNAKETRAFVREWIALSAGSTNSPRVIVFPPALVLSVFAEEANGQIAYGPQNVFFENQGAFTGENSPAVAKEMGASYALVGHSERRLLFAETNDYIAQKVRVSSECGLIPMLCIGETLQEREEKQTENVVSAQLEKGLSQLAKGQEFVVAYEPVWAIGTGRVATPEQAEEVHSFLRRELSKLRGGGTSEKTPILYGGSVKPDNAENLFAQPNIDGFLVGGASLKPADFAAIVSAAQSTLRQ